MRWLCLTVVVLVLAGCASSGSLLPPAPLSSAVLVSGERLESSIPPPTDSSDWLSTSPQMQVFLSNEAPGGSPQAQVNAIIAALQTPSSGRFGYQADATLTAAEAFDQRRANCLSFSAMLVSLLREVGIRARFQRAEVIPEWELRGDLAVRSQHINIVIFLRQNDLMVVDWPYQGDQVRALAPISDREALAEYHSNLGAEALVVGNIPLGFAELRRALELAPELAHIWSNLAVMYLRVDDEKAAESAWLMALELDPGQPSALGGLQRLYELEGRTDLVAELETRLLRERGKDPYHHYFEARRAVDRREWQAARDSLSTALAIRDDARFRRLLNDIDGFEAGLQ